MVNPLIRFLFSPFISAALFLLAPTSSDAFIFLRGSVYEKGERPVSQAPIWPTRTLAFLVNTNLSTMGGSLALPLSSAELLQAAEESVNAWAAACRADFRVVISGSTSTRYNSSDGVNVIQWDNRTTGEGNYYGASTSTLAAATTVLRGVEFADCDIVLNGNSTTTMTFSPAIGEADLRSVLTHEIGHCLGLDHPIEPPDYTSVDPFITEATMVQTAATGLDPSDSGRRDIAQDDRDGIECMYERGKPLRTGLHCGSYTGTNGQGALTGVVAGGPTVTDTACGGDAQGRNATPSLESGDGCIPSALAGTSRSASPRNPILSRVASSFGYLLFIAALFFFRVFRRRALFVFIFILSLGSREVSALDIELSMSKRKVDPTLWNSFAGMDPGATAWDRNPSPVKMDSLSEIRATAFSETTDWGKWGASLAFTLPQSLETNAKALSASEQSKRTTLSGIRLGPELRWFPAGSAHAVRWFVGGRFDLGLLMGSQNFKNASESSVSYRAWASELAVSTGVEVPLGALSLVAEGGYSRLHSSYFASSGNSGTGYSDFPSGTRISTNTGSGREDVRFSGSGFFATIGLQLAFGGKSEPEPRPRPVAEPEPEPAPEPTPEEKSEPKPPWEIDPIPSGPETFEQDSVTRPPNEPDSVPFLKPNEP